MSDVHMISSDSDGDGSSPLSGSDDSSNAVEMTYCEKIVNYLINHVDDEMAYIPTSTIFRAACPPGYSDNDIVMTSLACLFFNEGDKTEFVDIQDFPPLYTLNVHRDQMQAVKDVWINTLMPLLLLENVFFTRAFGMDDIPQTEASMSARAFLQKCGGSRDMLTCFDATLGRADSGEQVSVPWWFPEFAVGNMNVDITDNERERIRRFIALSLNNQNAFDGFVDLSYDILPKPAARHGYNNSITEWHPVFALLFNLAQHGLMGKNGVFTRREALDHVPFPLPGQVFEGEGIEVGYNGPVNESIRYHMRYNAVVPSYLVRFNHVAMIHFSSSMRNNDSTYVFDGLRAVVGSVTSLEIPVSEYDFETLDTTITIPCITLDETSLLHSYITMYTKMCGDEARFLLQPSGMHICRRVTLHDNVGGAEQFLNAPTRNPTTLFAAFNLVITWRDTMHPLYLMKSNMVWLQSPVSNFVIMYAMFLAQHAHTGLYHYGFSMHTVFVGRFNQHEELGAIKYRYKKVQLIVPREYVVWLVRHQHSTTDEARAVRSLVKLITDFLNCYTSPRTGGFPPKSDAASFFTPNMPPLDQTFNTLVELWRTHSGGIHTMKEARHVFETHFLGLAPTTR